MREPVVIEGTHRLIGVLHRPRGPQAFPGVLICHGYGGTKVGSQRLYVQLAERLEQCGIATFRLDFSGCGDSEGEFRNVTVTDLVYDARCGLDFLRQQCTLASIGLLGVSLGGAIASLAALEDGNVQSVALWAAVAVGQVWSDDWKAHFPDQVSKEGISCGGVVSGAAFCEQFLKLRADHAVAQLGQVPFLDVRAGCDRNVRAGHAAAIQKAREGSTALSRFVTLPQSGHSFTNPKERSKMLDETAKWFRATLEIE